MFNFLKKIFGLPTEDEIRAAKEAPYKIETPVVNTKTGDVVHTPPILHSAPVMPETVVSEVPAKKPRKPRTPKAEKPVKEKAAKAVKPAAKVARRSKKA